MFVTFVKDTALHRKSISIFGEQVGDRLRTLQRRIPAIELEEPSDKNGGMEKLGLILHLASGSDVEICGEGFNGRTVKVRQNGRYYFIFSEDLAG
jgi:hypothetical protein